MTVPAGTAPPSAPTANVIHVDRDGPIGWLLLDRPHRHNAQTPAMWEQLQAAGTALAADPSVRVIVFAGNGPSFSSGIDLDEITQPSGFIAGLARSPRGDPDPMLPAIHSAQDSFRWIRRAPKPVIAAIHGNALGAGLQLALACDLRIVADDAALGLLEVTHGLVPDMGATAWLRDLVGLDRAMDLVLSGRRLTGAEAAAAGLALRGVAAVDLRDEVRAYALVLAERSAVALAWAKASLLERDEERSIRTAGLGQAACVRAAWPQQAP